MTQFHLTLRRFHHTTTDSTNERALESLASGDACHLDVHVADVQTAGRGRRGRPWLSDPGEGLYLSLVWCPPALASGAALTVAAGLGTLAAVRSLGLSGARLKWPNDLMVEGAKLAGVLVETRGLDPSAPAYVVGIGLNVRQETFPDWLLQERQVTSLALSDLDASIEEAEGALLEHLQAALRRIELDPKGLANDYLAASHLSGRLTAHMAEEVISGDLLSLDLAKGLLLQTEQGPRCLPLERLRDLQLAAGES